MHPLKDKAQAQHQNGQPHLAGNNPFLHPPPPPLAAHPPAPSPPASKDAPEKEEREREKPKLPFRVLTNAAANPVETHGIVGTAKHTADELKNNPFLFFDKTPQQQQQQQQATTAQKDANPLSPLSPLPSDKSLNISSEALLEEGDRLVQDARERFRAALQHGSGSVDPAPQSPANAPSSPAVSIWAQAGRQESLSQQASSSSPQSP